MLVLERMTGHRISDFNFVFEFGGGYGSFARIAHSLGFRGQWIIHDLPELSALQRMYLGQRGVPISHSSSPILKPPPNDLSLAISMHAADEAGPTKLAAFVSLLPIYSHVFVTSGGGPLYWQSVMGNNSKIEPIEIPPGNWYICR